MTPADWDSSSNHDPSGSRSVKQAWPFWAIKNSRGKGSQRRARKDATARKHKKEKEGTERNEEK